MTLLATVYDLERRLGDPITDRAQAEQLLSYASSMVRAYTRRTWLDDAGELTAVPDAVRDTVVEITHRAAMNPAGVTQDSAGSSSVSFGPEAAQRMYLSAGDKIILSAHAAGLGGLTVLSTTRGEVETRSVLDEGFPW